MGGCDGEGRKEVGWGRMDNVKEGKGKKKKGILPLVFCVGTEIRKGEYLAKKNKDRQTIDQAIDGVYIVTCVAL